MAAIDTIIARLDELLAPAAFEDLGPNGLQVPGSRDVRRVLTGVSAQRELVERAVAAEAELVLVHHGLFWSFNPVGLTPVLAERLRPLFKHDIALAAYHLPLDAHPEVGNNALLAEALGCVDHVPFGDVGRGGTFDEPVDADELFARVQRVTEREPLVFDGGPPKVRRIAIVSGSGAGGGLPRAVAERYDAFLTGEPKEHVMADAREAGIHFIAAGHYATETFGVRRLGDLLAAEFGVEHLWCDIPNPV
jgi:dinuclear metal center YbgI/SA1388 family protein